VDLGVRCPVRMASRLETCDTADWKSALVRLRGRSHSGVKVPVRPQIHRPVTEGYCVVATRGEELPEVNCQSVTLIGYRYQQRELDSARRWDEPASAERSPLRSPSLHDGEGLRLG
jgi:hypothetical protein